MASGAIFARGTLLKIGDGGGTEAFTTIAECITIAGPDLTLDMIDVTSHDSSNGARERIGGVIDIGQITATINFIPTNATQNFTAGLIHDYLNRTKRDFQMVLPNTGATVWAFTALVNKFSVKAPHDKQLTADITLMGTGYPTLAG
jgi:predicted secreted protein